MRSFSELNKNPFFQTYLIQIAQVCNMALASFAIPYAIGFEQYGIYAALFSIPGVFQSLLETYIMMFLMNNTTNDLLNKKYSLVFAIILLVILCASYIILGLKMALLSSFLFIILFLRSAITAYAYSNLKVPILKIASAEFLCFLTYLVTFSYLCFILQNKTYFLPYYMVILGSVAFSFYLVRSMKLSFKKLFSNHKVSDETKSINTEGLLARLYEESFITLAPLILLQYFGSSIAGQFRFLMSIVKGASKCFPYKYELILRAYKSSTFDLNKFIKISQFFSVAFVIGFILFKTFEKHFNISFSNQLIMLVIGIGPIVSLLIIYPLASMLLTKLYLLLSVCFGITFLIMPFLGLNYFVISFIICNIVLLSFIFYRMKKLNINSFKFG